MATIKIGHLPKPKSQLITPLIFKMLIETETNTRTMAIERIICGFNFRNLLIDQVASLISGVCKRILCLAVRPVNILQAMNYTFAES